MNDIKSLKKYIYPRRLASLVPVLLVLFAVFSLCVGIVLNHKDYVKDAAPFRPGSDKKMEYGFTDAVGVSSWIERTDNSIYYAVVDADGFLSVARPEAYRIYGCTKAPV